MVNYLYRIEGFEMVLELINVTKRYKNLAVVDTFTLTLKEKSFVVLAGPSGCGKTTLLEMIAGFKGVDCGEIRLDGVDITNRKPSERNIAMVFQEPSLFPHLSAYENIAYGVAYSGITKNEADALVEETAKALSIDQILGKPARALSGGQKQRVAIARAIVRKPKLYLMDEPLSALDTKLKTQLRIEIAQLYKKMDASFLYVTHDQMEAMTLADTLVVMKDGMIQQVGKPKEIYNNPINMFVASFLGPYGMNYFEGYMQNGYLHCLNERVKLSSSTTRVIVGQRVEHMKQDENGSCGTIVLLEDIGDELYCHIRWNDKTIIIKRKSSEHYQIGDSFFFALDWEHTLFFHEQTKERLYLAVDIEG